MGVEGREAKGLDLVKAVRQRDISFQRFLLNLEVQLHLESYDRTRAATTTSNYQEQPKDSHQIYSIGSHAKKLDIGPLHYLIGSPPHSRGEKGLAAPAQIQR